MFDTLNALQYSEFMGFAATSPIALPASRDAKLPQTCLFNSSWLAARRPIEDPVHINDFHATLLHQFGLDHLRLSVPFGGLDLRLTNVGGRVVDKLLVT